MRYKNVTLESLHYTLPDQIVSSAEIERQLTPLYERIGLREGRLELMSGIRERRFWPVGTAPGQISTETANRAIEQSGVDRADIGCLIHASVCRDFLEPATASGVHHRLGLPAEAMIFDLSNACLGFLNGVVMVANMIELGQIRAGVVVATESSRDLVETAIADLNADESLTRNDIKMAFASLTIGSGSAAAVLTHRSQSRTGNRILGGTSRCATENHAHCQGGPDAGFAQPSTPRMRTDSEAMLHAGCELGRQTWESFKDELGWKNDTPDRFFCHQVGSAHRRLLQQTLELDPGRDVATLEWLGNTGSVALPMTMAIAQERGLLQPEDRFAMLGIGSGLNCLMLAGSIATSPVGVSTPDSSSAIASLDGIGPAAASSR